jgi:uncharacterized protein (DUF433 family)
MTDLGIAGGPGRMVPAFSLAIPIDVRMHFMKRELLQRITIEPDKCGGRPCVRGKRMRVVDILQLLSAGASFEEILAGYPFLERKDILAAIEYAAMQIDHVVLQSA